MLWVIHIGNFIHDFAAGCELPGLRRKLLMMLLFSPTQAMPNETLEIYSKLSLADAQALYNDVIGDFPIRYFKFLRQGASSGALG